MNRNFASRTGLVSLYILASLPLPLSACVNTSGTTEDGRHTMVGGFSPAKQLRAYSQTDLLERAAVIARQTSGSSMQANRIDASVALIYQGDYKQAIKLLDTLESESPGEYATATNLGTALELSGRNEEALKWINEGIRRNPDSHQGTEWLHAKILEAKIQAEKDPDFFKEHSVLDLDHSQMKPEATHLSIHGQQRSVRDVENALQYQLQERLQFVKSADAPVAGLLFDYAAITATTHSLEAAKELLQMAVEFGYPQDQVQPLLDKYDHLIFIANFRQWSIYLGISLLVIALIIYVVKRRWIVYRRSIQAV